MSKVAIATDSNSGITKHIAKKLGVYVLPMTFFVNGKQYYEEVDLSQNDFYTLIANSKAEVATSQPSPNELTDFWRGILKDYDELVYIPMSSGLSSSCTTASMMSREFGGRVHVVDNQRISVTQYQSVIDAKAMADDGQDGETIAKRLEEDAAESSIYIMVNKLTYLKRGGRVTAAGALIANVMNLKPVLQIQGAKLDAYAKSRGTKTARKTMIDAMKKDFETRFKDDIAKGNMTLHASYSDMKLFEIETWINEISEAFPGFEIHAAPLSLSIGCHIGPGSLAIACAKKTR